VTLVTAIRRFLRLFGDVVAGEVGWFLRLCEPRPCAASGMLIWRRRYATLILFRSTCELS
jgi:hypothetical protein